MKFNLEIWQDGATLDGTPQILLATHADVDIQWVTYGVEGKKAIARKDGKEVARMDTFDDYPIEILADAIHISGIVKPEVSIPEHSPESPYGAWTLKAKS